MLVTRRAGRSAFAVRSDLQGQHCAAVGAQRSGRIIPGLDELPVHGEHRGVALDGKAVGFALI